MLELIKTYWTIIITLVSWIVLLVKDHSEINAIKQDVKYIQENIDVREIDAMRKNYESLEKRYANLSNEMVCIKTLLSEISTKVTLLVNGKINMNGE